MLGGYGPWIAQAQGIKFRHIRVLIIGIELIRYQDHRHRRFLQAASHDLIRLRDAHLGVHHHNDDIGGFHGYFCLAGNRRMDTLHVGIPAAGVLYQKALTVPVRNVGNTITGNAWVVLYHRFTAAKETVNQGGLTHIGATDYGHRAQGFFRVVIGLHAKGTGEFFPLLFAQRLFRVRIVAIISLTKLRVIEVIVEFLGIEIIGGPTRRGFYHLIIELTGRVMELSLRLFLGIVISH